MKSEGKLIFTILDKFFPHLDAHFFLKLLMSGIFTRVCVLITLSCLSVLHKLNYDYTKVERIFILS